jgi:hypothetical protein
MARLLYPKRGPWCIGGRLWGSLEKNGPAALRYRPKTCTSLNARGRMTGVGALIRRARGGRAVPKSDRYGAGTLQGEYA